jgi:hypothetical protein
MFQIVRIASRIAATAILLAAAPAPFVNARVQASTSPADQKLLSDFTKKAKDYIDKEHALTADKMKPTTDVAKLEQERKQLRDAVQLSRPNAKQGEFFTPDTARIFRKVLANVLDGPEGPKIKASLKHSEPGASALFKVNAEFPNQNGQPIQSVPPTVLEVLPVLPKGLEYCIAGNALALRDSSANLVVDYLPNALP